MSPFLLASFLLLRPNVWDENTAYFIFPFFSYISLPLTLFRPPTTKTVGWKDCVLHFSFLSLISPFFLLSFLLRPKMWNEKTVHVIFLLFSVYLPSSSLLFSSYARNWNKITLYIICPFFLLYLFPFLLLILSKLWNDNNAHAILFSVISVPLPFSLPPTSKIG